MYFAIYNFLSPSGDGRLNCICIWWLFCCRGFHGTRLDLLVLVFFFFCHETRKPFWFAFGGGGCSQMSSKLSRVSVVCELFNFVFVSRTIEVFS